MRKYLTGALLGSALAAPALANDPVVTAGVGPGPDYFIRFLADVIDSETGAVIEQGIFNTTGEANEAINMLALLYISREMDCRCEDIRRDVFGAYDLEEDLYEGLRGSGYIPPFIRGSDIGTLPEGTGISGTYTINPGTNGPSPECEDGFWGVFLGNCPQRTTNFDASNPDLFARMDLNGIFVDTRIQANMNTRINQIMGGSNINNDASLCQFGEEVAGLDEHPLSPLVIRDLRETWPEG